MDCYIIRKPRILEIFNKYEDIAQKMKYKVFKKYRDHLRNPIKAHKEENEQSVSYHKSKNKLGSHSNTERSSVD